MRRLEPLGVARPYDDGRRDHAAGAGTGDHAGCLDNDDADGNDNYLDKGIVDHGHRTIERWRGDVHRAEHDRRADDSGADDSGPDDTRPDDAAPELAGADPTGERRPDRDAGAVRRCRCGRVGVRPERRILDSALDAVRRRRRPGLLTSAGADRRPALLSDLKE